MQQQILLLSTDAVAVGCCEDGFLVWAQYGPMEAGPIWARVFIVGFSLARAGLGPSPGWGPVRNGAHMGPYGPLWGPYGSSWTGPDMTKSGLLVQFRTFRVQNLFFNEISR